MVGAARNVGEASTTGRTPKSVQEPQSGALPETPVLVLSGIAGPLAAATLDDLLVATSAVTPRQAVTPALRV